MPDCLHNGYNMNIDGVLQPKLIVTSPKDGLIPQSKHLRTGTCISAISYSLSCSAFSEFNAELLNSLLSIKQFSLEKKCCLVTILLSNGVVLCLHPFLGK